MSGKGGRRRAASIISSLLGLACACLAPASARAEDEPTRVGLRVVEREGGVYVDLVVPGLPAARAGVEVGHRILAVGDEAVYNREQARRLLARFAQVDVLVLRLQPPAHERALVVGTAPTRADASTATTSAPRPYLGMSVRESDGALVVDKVAPESPAAASGLRVGDILLALDGQHDTTEAALKARLAALTPGVTIRLSTRGPARALAIENPRPPPQPLPAAVSPPSKVSKPSTDRHAIGQGGFGVFGAAVAAGNASAYGGGGSGRVRGLFGSFPGPEGGGAVAADVAAELFLMIVAAETGGATTPGLVLGARAEAGLFFGTFDRADRDGQSGVGIRLAAVATGGIVIADGRTAEGAGVGLLGGVEFAKFNKDSGRLRSIVVYVLAPVPQDVPTATGGLQFMF